MTAYLVIGSTPSLPWIPQLSAHSFHALSVHEETLTFRITGDIYFGDRNHFSNPAVLKRSKIFAEIPAYKQIKDEGLDESSARYYLLLEEANRIFRNHVKEVAEEKNFDLVVEKGGIKANQDFRFEDITKAVIKSLEE